ncbi:MAG TPA: alpha/beta hydrolase [Flavobacterium sp.]|jgi:hypothetical protein
MKIRILFTALLLCTTLGITAQTESETPAIETKVTLHTKTGDIFGTLETPGTTGKKMPVALIIAGSGPTDRDGNNPMMKNNSLKILASELSKSGIATLRYDKRGVAESISAVKSEADLRFEHYVDDAQQWIQLLKQDKRFSEVIVIGHSEGSLIGMMAGRSADRFISIAGPGQSADKALKEQMGAQPKEIQDVVVPMLESLAAGKIIDPVPQMLGSFLSPTVQPYMISWFKYDPQVEIKKLAIPILILQGSNDIQVSVDDAKRLLSAAPKADLVIVNNMNHILRIIEGDRQANAGTYANPALPVSSELVKSISRFILKK